MKKFSNYFLMVFAMLAVGFMTSCSDDDEVGAPGAPVISLSTDDGENEDRFSGYVGDSIALNISVSAPGGFNTLRVYRQVDGVRGNAIATYSKVSGTSPTSFDTTYVYHIQEGDVDDVVFLVFEAVDETGSSTLEYEINAEDRPTVKYEMKLLYAPNSNLASKTFFSTNDGMTYSVNDVLGTDESVSPKIDFGYFYGTQTGDFQATLASPAAYPIDYGTDGWLERNQTKIKKTDLAASAFLELENDEAGIDKAFDDASYGTNEGQARQLVVGDILAFELGAAKGNKRGLIKVNGITPGTGTDSNITIDVVVVD